MPGLRGSYFPSDTRSPDEGHHWRCTSAFARAVRNRLIAFNPREDTELPKVVARKSSVPLPRGGRRRRPEVVMERMGHAQIMTTKKYLHTLPDAVDKALVAFESVRRRLPV